MRVVWRYRPRASRHENSRRNRVEELEYLLLEAEIKLSTHRAMYSIVISMQHIIGKSRQGRPIL